MVRRALGMMDGGRAAHATRLAAVFVLVITAGAGCGDEACFSWTEQEGVCPSQEEAMSFFVSPGCVGSIQTVDSDGEFVEAPDDPIPGDLCCYDVTKSGDDFAFCEGGGF